MKRSHFQVLRALRGGPATLWGVLRSCDGPVRRTVAACAWLAERGWIERCEDRFRWASPDPDAARAAARTDFRREREQLQRILDEAPPPASAYFQERLTIDSLFRRLAMIYERGDLAGRRLFILGDDDLFSLAAALTGLPRRVVVAEIDERLVAFIAREARRRGLAVDAVRYNAADPLPPRLRRRFDVLVTDPVETPKGFLAMMSRGLAALRHPGAAYFGLSELECPPGRWWMFQRALHRAGLVLTDILRDHSWYVNESLDAAELARTPLSRQCPLASRSLPDQLWYRSSFHRAVTVRRPRPPIRGRVAFDDSFYVDPWVVTQPDQPD